jgi:hypothetical protein
MRLTPLSLLRGRHFEAREIGDAEGGRDRDVCGVTPAPHNNPADAGMIVTPVIVYQRQSRQTSNHPLKSIGLISTGTPMSPR